MGKFTSRAGHTPSSFVCSSIAAVEVDKMWEKRIIGGTWGASNLAHLKTQLPELCHPMKLNLANNGIEDVGAIHLAKV